MAFTASHAARLPLSILRMALASLLALTVVAGVACDGSDDTTDGRSEAEIRGDTLRELANKVRDKDADIYVGLTLGEEPILFIKGRAPDWVKKLVADSEYNLGLKDEQPFNAEELEDAMYDVSVAMGVSMRQVQLHVDGPRIEVLGVSREEDRASAGLKALKPEIRKLVWFNS